MKGSGEVVASWKAFLSIVYIMCILCKLVCLFAVQLFFITILYNNNYSLKKVLKELTPRYNYTAGPPFPRARAEKKPFFRFLRAHEKYGWLARLDDDCFKVHSYIL